MSGENEFASYISFLTSHFSFCVILKTVCLLWILQLTFGKN